MIKDGNHIGGENLLSFLMLGQSNMAGRGDISDVEPIKNYRTYMLRNGRFIRMSEPVNPDRPIFEGKFRSGISLAASFADELSRNCEIRVGLIPCADGGTSIDEWMPGTVLFDNALFTARLAMRSSRLSGILWHHGESDSASEESLLGYKDKFIKIITALRGELGMPSLPIIIGELSESISDDWKLSDRPKRLNRIFREIAAYLPECRVASSEGLTLKADGVHFDSKSLREFGKRYYKAYIKE